MIKYLQSIHDRRSKTYINHRPGPEPLSSCLSIQDIRTMPNITPTYSTMPVQRPPPKPNFTPRYLGSRRSFPAATTPKGRTHLESQATSRSNIDSLDHAAAVLYTRRQDFKTALYEVEQVARPLPLIDHSPPTTFRKRKTPNTKTHAFSLKYSNELPVYGGAKTPLPLEDREREGEEMEDQKNIDAQSKDTDIRQVGRCVS